MGSMGQGHMPIISLKNRAVYSGKKTCYNHLFIVVCKFQNLDVGPNDGTFINYVIGGCLQLKVNKFQQILTMKFHFNSTINNT